jgi:hypothetical protein
MKDKVCLYHNFAEHLNCSQRPNELQTLREKPLKILDSFTE